MLCVLVQMSSLMPADMLQRWMEDMGLSAAELRGMAVYVELGLLTSYAHMGVAEVSVEVCGGVGEDYPCYPSAPPLVWSPTTGYPPPASLPLQILSRLKCPTHPPYRPPSTR